MPDHQADIVIAGAGLSAALTALRLGRTARVVLVDRKPDPRAAHTWSFHAGDIPADAQAWLAPALRCRWAGQEVRFPGYGRRVVTELRKISHNSPLPAESSCPIIARNPLQVCTALTFRLVHKAARHRAAAFASAGGLRDGAMPLGRPSAFTSERPDHAG